MDGRAGPQVNLVPVHLAEDPFRESGAAGIGPGDARRQRPAVGIDGDHAVHGGAEADAPDVARRHAGSADGAADSRESGPEDLLRILLGHAGRRRAQRVADGVVTLHLALHIEDDGLGAGRADIDADDMRNIRDHRRRPLA